MYSQLVCGVLWCSVLCCRNWLDLQPDRHPAAVLLSAQVGCLLFVQLELPPQLGSARTGTTAGALVACNTCARCHLRRPEQLWGVWRGSGEGSSGCVQKFINEMQVPRGWAVGRWEGPEVMLQRTLNGTLGKKVFYKAITRFRSKGIRRELIDEISSLLKQVF